jgi:glycine reductase complex component B subunit gamma
VSRVTIAHYLNQFFAGIGGEDAADLPVRVLPEATGPGRLLQRHLGDRGAIVATIVGGDNYVNEHQTEALRSVREALERLRPAALVAGPAFNAGRYGAACAVVGQLATRELSIPSVAAMYPENPGARLSKDVVVVPTGADPSSMDAAMAQVARLGLKLGAGEPLGPAGEEGYLPRGIRRPSLRERPGYERALAMLRARLHGEPYQSEMHVVDYDAVAPAPPLADPATATLALITTGGIVPKGNPDRLVRGGSKSWYRYSLAGLDRLDAGDWDCVHRGFYIEMVKANPNYVLPLHTLRQLERGRGVGALYPWFFSTSGVGTAVVDARRMGEQMASELRTAGVDGALLVAT